MDINQLFYVVKRPFIMGFANEELRQLFLEGYTPQSGFAISDARKKSFFIFCSGHRFNAEFFLRSEEKAGFRIFGDAQIMSQNDTVRVLSEDKKIFGLDPEYMVYQKDWKVINSVSPFEFKEVLAFLGVDATVSAQVEENPTDNTAAKEEELARRAKAQLFYEVQGAVIENEREFFKGNLLKVSYSRVLTVTQNKNEASVFAFCTGALSDEVVSKLAEGKPFSVTLKNEKSGSVKVLRYSAAEELLYCSTFVSLDDIAAEGVLQEKENVGYRHIENAIYSLSRGTAKNSFLQNLILNHEISEVAADTSYKNPSLNAAQELAVQKALGAEDFLLIQGPPGTGKTKIIVEMVKEFIKQNKRILICSQSNHAVDNVLKKCLDLHFDAKGNPPVHCLRIGTDKIEAELKSNTLRPLTETIQGDMLKRSAESFAEYKRQREEQRAKVNSFADISRNMAYFLACFVWINDTVAPVSDALGNSFIEAFFTPEKLKKIRLSLKNAKGCIFNISNQLIGMLNSHDAPTSDPMLYFNTQIEGLNINLDICIRNLAEGGLFDLLFVKGDPVKELALVKKFLADQKNDFCGRLVYLREYPGNLAPEALPVLPPMAADQRYAFDYNDYCNRLSHASDALLKLQIDLENDLKSWHKVLKRDDKALSEALLKSIKIVGATCMSSQSREFADLDYDVAIVDEAGQITMHNLIVPLAKVKKVILVGDHIQLPPVEDQKLNEYLRRKLIPEFKELYPEKTEAELLYPFDSIRKLYSVSLFEILYNRQREENFSDHCVMLDTQYRCHPQISDFVSEHFYENTYHSGLKPDQRLIDIAGYTAPVNFIDTAAVAEEERFEKYKNSSVINTLEASICAKKCVKIVTAILENPEKYDFLMDDYGNFEVGVISGYSAQVRLLHKEIHRLLTEYFMREMSEEDAKQEANYMMERISVDSLDSFQGMEKEIIIFSATRSNKPGMKNMKGEPLKRYTVGFLDDTRRLNVLMTRAKRLLVIVGDSSTLKGSTQLAKHNRKSVGKLFTSLLEKSLVTDAAKGRDTDEQ